MAVIEHSITFGGVNSADFGIFIYGDGSFDAPKRAVEMVSIPGRNGELAMDKGYFENIEVTYPAFYDGDDWTDFAQQIADFRNALCSQFGYQRLEDTFNTGEYRMGTYKDGLEVDLVKYNSAGHFDITFNCMPQRFLTDGENPIEVSSGDVVTNPTLFESKPLLEVLGYGTINIGGDAVELENIALGEVVIGTNRGGIFWGDSLTRNYWVQLDSSLFNAGDAVTTSPFRVSINYTPISGITLNSCSVSAKDDGMWVTVNSTGSSKTIEFPSVTFTAANSPIQKSVTFTQKYTEQGVEKTISDVCTFTATLTSENRIRIAMVFGSGECWARATGSLDSMTVKADSSVSALGHPTYIDLDTGEAWHEDGGSAVSLNNVIQLPANLPALGAGDTTITFDNTITALSIVPRWYKL